MALYDITNPFDGRLYSFEIDGNEPSEQEFLEIQQYLASKNKSAFGLDDALGRVIGLTNTIANLEEQRTKLVEFPSADNADRIAAIDQELRQARELRDKLQKSYTGISPIKISKNERQGIGAV